MINSEGLKQLNTLADKAEAALVSGQGTVSTIIWGQMEDVVENVSICELICEKGSLLLKHLKRMRLLCTRPYTYQWIFTKLYLSLKQ